MINSLLIKNLLQLYSIFRAKFWQSRLYTPTMIQKIDDTYFISDCWHNRIIYSKKLSAPIKRWKTLSDEVFGGHTLAYGGKFVLADNTDKDSIFVWKKDEIFNE